MERTSASVVPRSTNRRLVMMATNVLAQQNAANVVAVSSEMVQQPGGIIWWRKAGAIPYEKFVAAWTAAGFDEKLLGKSCGPEKALRRAVDAQKEKGRIRRKAPQGGWLIKASKLDMARNDEDLITELKVHLDDLGRLHCEPPDHRCAAEIQASFDAALSVITAEDMTDLLTGLVEHLGGVTMREGGGVYFIPPASMPTWTQMVAVIQGISAHRIYKADAMRLNDIMDAILAGMQDEVLQATKRMEKDLAEERCGSRGLRNRAQECERIEEKIGGYEKLLGTSLTAIHDKMEALQANIAAAILQAEAEEAEKESA
jgi:hypothetical protein